MRKRHNCFAVADYLNIFSHAEELKGLLNVIQH